MRRVVAVVLLAVLLLAFPAGASAQESFTTVRLHPGEWTIAQKYFTAGGALSVVLDVEDDFANLVPIVGAVVYEYARPEKSDTPFESAMINVFLYYTSRVATATLTQWIFGR